MVWFSEFVSGPSDMFRSGPELSAEGVGDETQRFKKLSIVQKIQRNESRMSK